MRKLMDSVPQTFKHFVFSRFLRIVRTGKCMKTQPASFFRIVTKAAFVCFLVVVRSSAVFATAEKSNSILSYRNAPQFQKAILITHHSERTSAKGGQAQFGHSQLANVTKPLGIFSSRLPTAGTITDSFFLHTNISPRGPPII